MFDYKVYKVQQFSASMTNGIIQTMKQVGSISNKNGL